MAPGRWPCGNRASLTSHSMGNNYPRHSPSAAASEARRRSRVSRALQSAGDHGAGSVAPSLPLCGTQRARRWSSAASTGLAMEQPCGPASVDSDTATQWNSLHVLRHLGAPCQCQRRRGECGRPIGPNAGRASRQGLVPSNRRVQSARPAPTSPASMRAHRPHARARKPARGRRPC